MQIDGKLQINEEETEAIREIYDAGEDKQKG